MIGQHFYYPYVYKARNRICIYIEIWAVVTTIYKERKPSEYAEHFRLCYESSRHYGNLAPVICAGQHMMMYNLKAVSVMHFIRR
jgi:hypothetical protein